jgi:GT2 family glycosyltransferase
MEANSIFMEDNDTVPVVIPVFNRPEYAMACLEALASSDAGAKVLPVIVDNGSRLRTKNLIEEWAARVGGAPPAWLSAPVALTLPDNRGFAGGANAGLRSVMPCRRAFVMHDDCIPFDGWAGEMLACLDQGDDEHAVVLPMTNYANEHGMCVPEARERFQALKPSNKSRVTDEEIRAIISGTYPEGVPEFLSNLRRYEPRFQYSVEIASFCMLIRGDLLDKYGLFDEDFFPRMWEDKFWFQALERAGFIAMIARRAFVHHFGNITSDGPGFNFSEISKINEERFKAKCYERDKARKSAV